MSRFFCSLIEYLISISKWIYHTIVSLGGFIPIRRTWTYSMSTIVLIYSIASSFCVCVCIYHQYGHSKHLTNTRWEKLHIAQAHINFSHCRAAVLLSSLKIVTNVFPQRIKVFRSVFKAEIVQHTAFCFTFAHALFKCACKRIYTLD